MVDSRLLVICSQLPNDEDYVDNESKTNGNTI